MICSKQYVVVDQHADGSRIIAVYGPFPDEETAKRWPGLPGGPHGVCVVHVMYAAPEWYEGHDSDG